MAVIRSWLNTIQSYFDDIPIKPLYTRTKVLLVRVRVGQIWKAMEVGFQREGFKLRGVS